MMDATKYQIGYYPPPVEPGHVYEGMQKTISRLPPPGAAWTCGTATRVWWCL